MKDLYFNENEVGDLVLKLIENDELFLSKTNFNNSGKYFKNQSFIISTFENMDTSFLEYELNEDPCIMSELLFFEWQNDTKNYKLIVFDDNFKTSQYVGRNLKKDILDVINGAKHETDSLPW